MQNGLWRKELALIIIGFFLAMSFNLPVSGNEIIDNHPPVITSFMWVTNGYVGESYKLILNATDPDGDDVYFFINWADGSDSGWVGPYKSGEAVDVYHAWENIGTYYFRFKAKDIYGAESNWSELYSVSITITAHVKIRIHRGFGVGVTVTIKNLGVKDFENIPWYCYFYRQKRSPPPWPEIQEKQGILTSLKVGETRTIRSGSIFGFALRSYISFSFSEPIGSHVSHWVCKLIGPFVYVPILYGNP